MAYTILANLAAGNQPLSIIDANFAQAATLASPAFTGVPTAPTAAGGTNTNQIATTAFVAGAIGGIQQIVSTVTGAVATGTTQVPLDDTIPQNTEGDQYMTLSITPKSTTSKLLIQVVANLSAATGDTVLVMSLFQDSTANALATVMANCIAGTSLPYVLNYVMTSGSTSATTFKVRAGPTAAITVTFNGTGGARKFGGVFASSMVISEIGL